MRTRRRSGWRREGNEEDGDVEREMPTSLAFATRRHRRKLEEEDVGTGGRVFNREYVGSRAVKLKLEDDARRLAEHERQLRDLRDILLCRKRGISVYCLLIDLNY